MKKLILTAATLISIATPALADMAERNAAWSKYIEWAFQRSAQQNNGKADFHRECVPKKGFCFMSVTYIDMKGQTVQAVVYTDKNGEVYKRNVNRFNSFSDNVVSLNWDSGEAQQAMFDGETRNWVDVK